MIDPNNLDNDDDRHIDSAEQFMGVCMERLQGIDKTTNEKLFTITAMLNEVQQFVIADAKYQRMKYCIKPCVLSLISTHLQILL